MPYDQLWVQFRKQSEHLIKKIYANLRPKSMNGVDLTGWLYADLVLEFVYSINKDGLPKIHTSWVRVLE